MCTGKHRRPRVRAPPLSSGTQALCQPEVSKLLTPITGEDPRGSFGRGLRDCTASKLLWAISPTYPTWLDWEASDNVWRHLKLSQCGGGAAANSPSWFEARDAANILQ